MELSLDDLKTLTHSSKVPRDADDPKQVVSAIIRVRKPDYVPRDVTVRARIAPDLLTATFPLGKLGDVEADQFVQSVSVSKPLRIID